MSPYPRRFTPRMPWRPMTDSEWHALLPFVMRRAGPGRPLGDLRTRMDGIFHAATADRPWKDLPSSFGKPDTVSRHMRRLTHAGLWQALARALVDLSECHPLRAIEHFICRAIRRVKRLLGLPMILLLRRLNLLSGLWAPPWLLPNPDFALALLEDWTVFLGRLRPLVKVLRTLLGQRRIPLAVQRAWE